MRLHRLRVTAFGPFSGTEDIGLHTDEMADCHDGTFTFKGLTRLGTGNAPFVEAALMRDGTIVAAIENHKLQPGLAQRIPEAAIQFCLDEAGTSWVDLDMVAVASNPLSSWRRRALSRAILAQESVYIAFLYAE